MAPIVEGTFSVDWITQSIRETSGRPLDAEMFSRLGLILIQAKLEGLAAGDLAEKIAPIAPVWAKRFAAVADNPTAFATLLGAAIGGIMVVAAAMINSHSSTESQQPPPLTIILPQPDGLLNRDKDRLYYLRQRSTPPPAWARSYLET